MESVLAVARNIDDEVFRSEHRGDPAAQVFVIFDEQYAHGHGFHRVSPWTDQSYRAELNSI